MDTSAIGDRNAQTCRPVRLQDPPRRLVTVLEQPAQLLFEKTARHATAQPTERRLVLDFVSQGRAPRPAVQKEVPVIPPGEWTSHLTVGEEPACLVLGV